MSQTLAQMLLLQNPDMKIFFAPDPRNVSDSGETNFCHRLAGQHWLRHWSGSVAVDYNVKLLKFILLLLAAVVAGLGAIVVFFITIGVTLALVLAHWIYLIILRAREYMLRKLANPLPFMPAAAAQANVYYVPDQPPPYQPQVPMYGVGGAFPSAPGYQSSVYNKTIQEVCTGLLFPSFFDIKNWGKSNCFPFSKIAFSDKNFKTTITKFLERGRVERGKMRRASILEVYESIVCFMPGQGRVRGRVLWKFTTLPYFV